MKKINWIIVVAVALLAATFAFAHHGPESVTIDAAKNKQSGVTFPHAAHQKAIDSCDTCHHTNKGLTDASDKDVKKCSSCHLNPKGDVPDMGEMSLKKNPFHMLCINCHKEDKKGPTKCKECHE